MCQCSVQLFYHFFRKRLLITEQSFLFRFRIQEILAFFNVAGIAVSSGWIVKEASTQSTDRISERILFVFSVAVNRNPVTVRRSCACPYPGKEIPKCCRKKNLGRIVVSFLIFSHIEWQMVDPHQIRIILIVIHIAIGSVMACTRHIILAEQELRIIAVLLGNAPCFHSSVFTLRLHSDKRLARLFHTCQTVMVRSHGFILVDRNTKGMDSATGKVAIKHTRAACHLRTIRKAVQIAEQIGSRL